MFNFVGVIEAKWRSIGWQLFSVHLNTVCQTNPILGVLPVISYDIEVKILVCPKLGEILKWVHIYVKHTSRICI